MPRINQLPVASSVAQSDVLAIDTPEKTYQVPRSVLAPAPFQVTIQPGYWSGSGSDYYFTVYASNVTANAQLYPFYDKVSDALLNGPVWAIPADGSFTIHTSAIPNGTVTISVLLAGIVGEAQYQVLADVYSRAQVDTIVAQSTAAFAGTNKRWYNNADLDNFTVSGYYPMGTLLTNAPADWGILTVIAVRNDTIEQIFYASSNRIYRRECRIPSGGSEPVWSAWSELATVDYVAQSTANIVSGGLTAAANVTINNQYKAANGNLRIYTLIFTTTAAITKRTPLVTGFDVQKIAANGVTTFLMWNNSAMDTKQCFLDSNNALQCNDDLPSNYHLRGTIVYLAQ